MLGLTSTHPKCVEPINKVIEWWSTVYNKKDSRLHLYGCGEVAAKYNYFVDQAKSAITACACDDKPTCKKVAETATAAFAHGDYVVKRCVAEDTHTMEKDLQRKVNSVWKVRGECKGPINAVIADWGHIYDVAEGGSVMTNCGKIIKKYGHFWSRFKAAIDNDACKCREN
jgi:hypothetical protein